MSITLAQKISDHVRAAYLNDNICVFEIPRALILECGNPPKEELDAAIFRVIGLGVIERHLSIMCPNGHEAWGGKTPKEVIVGDNASERAFLEILVEEKDFECFDCGAVPEFGHAYANHSFVFREHFELTKNCRKRLDRYKDNFDAIEFYVDLGCALAEILERIKGDGDPYELDMNPVEIDLLVAVMLDKGRLIQDPRDQKLYVTKWYPRTIERIKQVIAEEGENR